MTKPVKRTPYVGEAAATSPLVDRIWIRDWLGHVGRDRVEDALAHPDAPRPLLGGYSGARALWSRSAITAYFNRIVESGEWPQRAREAA